MSDGKREREKESVTKCTCATHYLLKTNVSHALMFVLCLDLKTEMTMMRPKKKRVCHIRVALILSRVLTNVPNE